MNLMTDEAYTMDDRSSVNPFTAELNVPFPSAREANIAYGSLSVDKEPKRGGVTRLLSVKEEELIVQFKANDARTLRVSINSLFEHLKLVSQTIHMFGPPKQLS